MSVNVTKVKLADSLISWAFGVVFVLILAGVGSALVYQAWSWVLSPPSDCLIRKAGPL